MRYHALPPRGLIGRRLRALGRAHEALATDLVRDAELLLAHLPEPLHLEHRAAVIARRIDEEGNTARVRRREHAAVDMASVAPAGLFTRVVQNKVGDLMRDGRQLEAMLYGVGAAMLDAWLGVPLAIPTNPATRSG